MSLYPKILVIDDEPQIHRFLRAALEAAGFEPLRADSGAEGLREIARAAPAAVVLDLGLPDMDGKDGADPRPCVLPGADHHPLGARPRDRKDRGARPGRQRLCGEAVRRRRAARPPAGGAAPALPFGEAAAAGHPRRRTGDRLSTTTGDPRRRAGAPVAEGIRSAGAARAERRQGHAAPRAADSRSGARRMSRTPSTCGSSSASSARRSSPTRPGPG